MSFSFERPLVPNDEKQIEEQFHNPKFKPAPPLSSDFSTVSVPETVQSRAESSGKHVYGASLKRPPVAKALTDTSNFISMYDNRNDHTNNDNSEELTGALSPTETGTDTENGDEAISLDSEEDTADPSSVPPLTPKELSMNETLKKRHEEWAERGAAKIVKEVTNPATGVTTQHIIKKGIKDFKFGEILGDGSYSTVMLATSNDSGKKYAVKVLNKEYLIRQKKVKYVNIEKNTLQRLNNSRGVIKLYFTFQDEASLYFLLEYAPNGDFLSVMKKFGSLNEECCRYYGAQILDAIDFIHKNGVVHRDIKPENILLDEHMKVKLTDFGTAKLLDRDEKSGYNLLKKSRSFVGTAEYVSPELLNDNCVDYKCDIWAFGCILYQMIAGKPPFKATNEYLTFQKVMKVQYAFTAGFPLVIRDLVKQLLVKSPEARLNASQVKSHHFFKSVNFKDGSVWDAPAPQIAPYKVTAKAMQPVPGLKDSKHRTVISLPKRPTKSASTSQLNTVSVMSDSKHTREPTAPSSPAPLPPAQRAPVDARTAQILDNIKKEINTRKQLRAKRSVSAASAAAAALSKKPPTSSPLPASGSRNLDASASSSAKIIASSSSVSSPPSPSPTSSSSSVPVRAPHSSPQMGRADRTPSSTNYVLAPPSTNPVPSMNKIDILWSYYLTNIDERVVRMGEITMAIVKTQVLEKRAARINALFAEPQPQRAAQRTTLLSQVARGGGGVTGFRTEDHSNLREEDYYSEWTVSQDMVLDSYRKPESEDGEAASGVPNKLKKLFHTKSDADGGTELLPLGEYLKKMVVITTFGRCLIFVKRKTTHPQTNLFYDLQYEIHLSQNGVRVKEVVVGDKPVTPDPHGIFAVQTPFNSFVFRCDHHDVTPWLNGFAKSAKKNHERLLAKHREEEPSDIANKAAKLASPVLAQSTVAASNGAAVPKASLANATSPRRLMGVRPTSAKGTTNASISGGSGSGSGGSGGSGGGDGKHGRLFDTFVSTKGKHTKRGAKPVPQSSKLVNGLPTTMTAGLGINSDNDLYSAVETANKNVQNNTYPYSSSKGGHLKSVITGKKSRLLARSEHTLRK